ncbi:MAG: ATP-binding protein [Thermodesulfobacteriota bacterium]
MFRTLQSRLREPRRFLQVLAGPRQVGKTTLARQAMEALRIRSHYASADEPTLRDRAWIGQQWDIGRLKAAEGDALLVLDEVQKIPGWSEVVKRLWDEDSLKGVPLKCVLLGSSPLLLQRGLTESLAGRFELLHVTHWSFAEMRDAFGWDVERYVFFGGYPGAAPLIEEPQRWSRYIVDSLIETTVSLDLLLMTRVDKPALLRRLFLLGCDYSGQVLSYQKMLGQLQESGNTTTLARYLELLAGAGMLKGIPKYSGKKVLQRGSSPKLQVLNTALMTSQSRSSMPAARRDREYWGRLVESAVGTHLLNGSAGSSMEIYYWRDRNREVDFVLASDEAVVPIEVKSGRVRTGFPGMEAFGKRFSSRRTLVVGGQGIPLEEFLATPVSRWME